MEKKLVFAECPVNILWNGRVSIDEMRGNLDELERLNVTHIMFDPCYIAPCQERLETDAEYKMRMDRVNELMPKLKVLEGVKTLLKANGHTFNDIDSEIEYIKRVMDCKDIEYEYVENLK